MEVIIINILIALVCGLIPTLLTLYLNERVKGSVKNSFDEKLEKLKKEHTKEISQFQTDLNYLKSKENFKFTKLHEKRFEVLQETYKFLNQTIRLLHIYVSPLKSTPTLEFTLNRKIQDIPTEKDVSLEFQELFNKFSSYFQNNAIFFDEKIEKLLIDYFTESGDIFLISYSNKSLQKMKIGIYDENQKTIDLMFEKIPTLIFPIKKEIEIKFRELLGE